MIATHTHAQSRERLVFIEQTGMGSIAIFENLDCPYLCRITCPNTREFVIPYFETSNAQKPAMIHLRNEWPANRGAVGKSFHTRGKNV